MPEARHYSLGDALEECYDCSLADWRKTYAASTAGSDLFAGPLTGVTMTTTFQTGGRALVAVQMAARRRQDQQVYYFVMQRHEDLWTFPHGDF